MDSIICRWSDSNVWGSYDRRYINAILHKEELYEIKIGIFQESTNTYFEDFTWNGVAGNPSISYFNDAGVYHTGLNSIDGCYHNIGLYYKDFKFDIEFSGEGEDFVYKITPQILSDDYYFYVKYCYIMEGNLDKQLPEIYFYGSNTNKILSLDKANYCFRTDSILYITSSQSLNNITAEDYIHTISKKIELKNVKGHGILGEDIVCSMIKAMTWNKVYDFKHKTFKSDVTRIWAKDSCYYTFYWDNLLTSLIYAMEDEKMAYNQVDSVCSEFNGTYLPQCAWDWGPSNMINPPIGSYCINKLFTQYQNIDLLKQYFDCLYSTNCYYFNTKSPRRNGLIILNDDHNNNLSTTNIILGTGLDNSPMYDCLGQTSIYDVGLSSIFALDCKMLANIAKILKRDEEYNILLSRYELTKTSISTLMWDDKNGIFTNITAAGEYTKVITPTSFYPLISSVASKNQAERLIREHLLNEEEFWGDFVIPSVSKKESSYEEQNYWRGCAWPPMNYLVYVGLKNYEYYELANELALKSLKMYRDNWTKHGWVLENFNTKNGGPTKNTVPMYTWGTLMAFMEVEEFIDASPFCGITFGSIGNETGSITNYRIENDLYDVKKEANLSIYKNGKLIINCDSPAIVHSYVYNHVECSFELVSKNATKCTIYDSNNGEWDIKITDNKQFVRVVFNN